MQLFWRYSACIVNTYIMIPPMKKVVTMVFEERVVTHENWLKCFSWQMTLSLGFSEPPCESVWPVVSCSKLVLLSSFQWWDCLRFNVAGSGPISFVGLGCLLNQLGLKVAFWHVNPAFGLRRAPNGRWGDPHGTEGPFTGAEGPCTGEKGPRSSTEGHHTGKKTPNTGTDGPCTKSISTSITMSVG